MKRESLFQQTFQLDLINLSGLGDLIGALATGVCGGSSHCGCDGADSGTCGNGESCGCKPTPIET